jgi:hypothetical protein
MTDWSQNEGALRAMWNEGHSAAEIAAVFETTRNAVIGKLDRLGLIGLRRFEAAVWNAPVRIQPPTPPRRFSWEQHA